MPLTVPAVPSGAMLPYGGTVAPVGWLVCNGASYPTASYPTLFAAIGYTFGGAGANFNVPDLRDRFPIGANTFNVGAAGGQLGHSHTEGSHSHTLGAHVHGSAAHTHDMQSHSHNYTSIIRHYHSTTFSTAAGGTLGTSPVNGVAQAVASGRWNGIFQTTDMGTTRSFDGVVGVDTGTTTGPNNNTTTSTTPGNTGGPSGPSDPGNGAGTGGANPPFLAITYIIKV